MQQGTPAREAEARRLRVFVLDDHELVRRGLQELLEGEGFEVVGTSATAAEATRRIPALRPDVSVLDVRLPDGTGIEVCRDVHAVDPSLPCVMLTSYNDEESLRGAILAGANGYVLKEIRGTELITALRRAARGESLFDPAVRAKVLAGLTPRQEDSDPRLELLSPQEHRVLTLIGEGMTNREIGEKLFLAEKTVKNYVSSLLAKLGYERRTQAALFIARSGRTGP